MGVGQFTPGLRAGGTIRPYRFVKVESSEDNSALECDANEEAIGVTDGSNKEFDRANHAEDGDQIRLQPGEVVRAEAGGTFNAGDNLKTDADGKAVVAATTGTTNQNVVAVALEDGAVGKIVSVRREPKVIRPAIA